MTKMLTRYYRIPTSLSIAVARVAEMMPRACVLPDGIATLTLERQDQDEACYLVLRPTEYMTTCGAWQVRVEPERMQWTHAGAQVTLTPDGESVFAGSDAHQESALGDVRALLPQLKLPDHFWAWRLDARLVAVTPTETIAAWWTLRMGDVAQQLEQRVNVLWQAREAEEELVALFEEPQPGAPLDAWFDYYHRKREAGERITLREIADKAGYSAGYIRKEHLLYKQERGG